MCGATSVAGCPPSTAPALPSRAAPTHVQLHDVPPVGHQVRRHPVLLRPDLQLLLRLKGQPAGVLIHAPLPPHQQLLHPGGVPGRQQIARHLCWHQPPLERRRGGGAPDGHTGAQAVFPTDLSRRARRNAGVRATALARAKQQQPPQQPACTRCTVASPSPAASSASRASRASRSSSTHSCRRVAAGCKCATEHWWCIHTQPTAQQAGSSMAGPSAAPRTLPQPPPHRTAIPAPAARCVPPAAAGLPSQPTEKG